MNFGKLVDLSDEDEFVEEPLHKNKSKTNKNRFSDDSDNERVGTVNNKSSSSSIKPVSSNPLYEEDEFDRIHRSNQDVFTKGSSASGSGRRSTFITEEEFNTRLNNNYYSYNAYSSSEDEDDDDKHLTTAASKNKKDSKSKGASSSSSPSKSSKSTKSKVAQTPAYDSSDEELDDARTHHAKSKKDKTDIRVLTEQQSALDKKISSYLSIIDRSWTLDCDENQTLIQGELLKKSRFTSGWKKYYFVLTGNQLHYYKNKGSKKPKGVITISFVTPPISLLEKNIIDMKTSQVSNYQLQIFSNKRIDSVCAVSNEEFERWNNVLQNLIKTNLEPNDYDERLENYKIVSPLFEQKTQVELDRLLVLLQEIDTYSKHVLNKSKKEKSGNLLMMEDNDDQVVWKSYYFVLIDKCLYYYKSSKLPPQGVITLKYTDISIMELPDNKHCFKLQTPLSVYILKAKHHVAMKDWILALNNSKEGKKVLDMPSMDRLKLNQQPRISEEGVQQHPITGYGKKFTATIIVTPPNMAPTEKPSTFKLNLGTTTIGRSDSCTVTLDDKQVSRSHCKIEVSDNSVIIIDLGSGHGTRVNHKRVSKAYLLPGDRLRIGKTLIKFEAVKKKKNKLISKLNKD
ncbi:hypothetical protein DICPUDRAFT_152205 [Dictyostelium purpureum]|uniref:PH domain-containing protein n=1 Tax=Dictyostelium purpureum TaxID=5786 RepID=F0ZKR1_DICPU|nr:uncharacterized protein DICPUDRAFT_152205 [Dictyostelium purpureum]EGC35474.1 hypothetical protein DICPUDRAFT_152205 [Dictyostelium purpureum]|eukprot:XP_003288017.1 hypothetical protein DICPUDRAFT_152205 [Dictyostelium purpureum]